VQRLTRGGPRWKDRGRVDGAPPPPYEESQRSHQQVHDSKTLSAHLYHEPNQMNGKPQRRRHPATAGRRVAGSGVRHRKPIPQRFHTAAYNQQPVPSQPVQVQDIPSGPFDFKFGQVEEEGEDEADDQVRYFLSALYAYCADRRHRWTGLGIRFPS